MFLTLAWQYYIRIYVDQPPPCSYRPQIQEKTYQAHQDSRPSRLAAPKTYNHQQEKKGDRCGCPAEGDAWDRALHLSGTTFGKDVPIQSIRLQKKVEGDFQVQLSYFWSDLLEHLGVPQEEGKRGKKYMMEYIKRQNMVANEIVRYRSESVRCMDELVKR